MKHFPLYIDISHKNILVIGGGRIADRRITTLLSFGPSITLLSPDASELLQSYAAEGKLEWVQDSFPNNPYRLPKNNAATSFMDFKKFDMIMQSINWQKKNPFLSMSVTARQNVISFFLLSSRAGMLLPVSLPTAEIMRLYANWRQTSVI